MTVLDERPAATTPAARIPAWGVSVDLTPREITQSRQTKVVRRLVGLGLVVVLMACVGLTLLARDGRAAAEQSYLDAQAQTSQLQSASHDYDGLVTLQTVTQQTATQAATLLTDDVDFVNLAARIRAALPADVTINNLAIVLAPAAEATAAVDPSVDTGDIGTVTVTGNGSRIKALAPFVARLNHMRGIEDVIPTSTTETETGMQYSLTMSFTSELYTHRFDGDDAQGDAQ